jgi:hypothetical protein
LTTRGWLKLHKWKACSTVVSALAGDELQFGQVAHSDTGPGKNQRKIAI